MSKTIPFVEVARTLGELNVGIKLNGNVVVDTEARVIGILIGDHLTETDLRDYVIRIATDPGFEQRRLQIWCHILDEKQLGVHGGQYDGAKVKPLYGDYWLVNTADGIELLDDFDIERLELSADYMTVAK